MKAVVMAGGEGTRLRPLTSNQPKPMVPIVGKPCIEHILELLRAHGFQEIVVTVAFLPQAIRGYFGDGSNLGLELEYSVEEVPLGTAGSVRLASERLEDTTLVISGDALCDIDLTRLVEFHKQKGAAVTIGLKSVENPLEFGIVVTDEDGRIERFLEKPSWGQVFSDTINTGIYVLEPEVLTHVPTDGPFDFSKELFPLLLEMGRPMYGFVCDGYWQDIGNLDQFRQANFDALDERVHLNIPGIRLRGNVWIGEGVEIDQVAGVAGPAFIGSYARIAPDAAVMPYSVLGSGATVRERAHVSRSVVDFGTYIGRASVVEGSILGRNCEVRAHVHLHEGVAIGDEVTIGEQSVVYPGVRIYPYKEVESGAELHESLIWESRASTRLFGNDGVAGLVNVDVTPEVAVRLGAALGTALPRGSNVVATRESPSAYRMIKRAIIVGLNAAGVNVADLQTMPSAVGKHHLNAENFDAAFHVGGSPADPELVRITIFERPGISLSAAMQREVEKHFSRQELRRVPFDEVGSITYPMRTREIYADSLLATLDEGAIRDRGFKIVVDYGYSAASLVLPFMLGRLGVEAIATHPFDPDGGPRQDGGDTVDQGRRLVGAVGADLGAVFDRAGERLYLIDEQANEVPMTATLLLFIRLLAQRGRGGRLVLPTTVTGLAEELATDALEVVRTPSALAELTKAAAADGAVFAGAPDGRYVFPDFLPAFDATAALCKLLELLAPQDRPLSALVAELPQANLLHTAVQCSWALKGTVMRVLNERFADGNVDLRDGIKVYDGRGWAQVLPDPDEPLVHIYAEGASPELSTELEEEYRGLVSDVLAGEEIHAAS
ncbi:MAG: NTP transferase domain-containing protein [Actinobacteria bacterium]|nr:NTP transferase domain-containing protein [Actinomycetota bacterium]MBV8394834.1 NTP transferase domain-containing protein [Actinomycetota bacterium]MBV8598823.1 NTP transferase domain-containing protein [Actinomycetota bacterium]